jgi:hypothetical protein
VTRLCVLQLQAGLQQAVLLQAVVTVERMLLLLLRGWHELVAR